MSKKLNIILVLSATSIGFAIADGPDGPEGCYLWTLPGMDKILGEYNGCTACTSDIPHGDGSCSGEVGTGGTRCYTTSQSDTYYTRAKKPSPQFCTYCEQTNHNYTYLVPHEGINC